MLILHRVAFRLRCDIRDVSSFFCRINLKQFSTVGRHCLVQALCIDLAPQTSLRARRNRLSRDTVRRRLRRHLLRSVLLSNSVCRLVSVRGQRGLLRDGTSTLAERQIPGPVPLSHVHARPDRHEGVARRLHRLARCVHAAREELRPTGGLGCHRGRLARGSGEKGRRGDAQAGADVEGQGGRWGILRVLGRRYQTQMRMCEHKGRTALQEGVFRDKVVHE